MINIGICEDRLEDCNRLHLALQDYFAGKHNVNITEYQSAEALLTDVEDGKASFHVIFMDIFLKKMDGIEAAHILRKQKVRSSIVFLTNSADYAVESYDVDASGYLLKPFDEEKLHKILDKVMKSFHRKRIAVRCARDMEYIYLDEIVWVESQNKVSIYHLEDGRILQSRTKLDEIEAHLSDPRFLRCHQSYLVNMDHVVNVKNDFFMSDGSVVPIRMRSRKQIADAYYNYFISKI